MIIKIPFKTPTVNNLYGKTFRHGGLYLKNEARVLKKEIKDLIEEGMIKYEEVFCLKEKTKLKVKVEIHENWYTKKGEIKRKDIANREKFLIDSVFDAIGIDDKYIFEHTMKKVQSEEEFALVKITEMNTQ